MDRYDAELLLAFAPIPPKDKIPAVDLATYLVFPWGSNDPEEAACHDRDIPSQPSHVYSCLLAVQTPPEQSLTKPEPIPGLSDPSTAFPKGCCTDVCLVSIPEAVNTIPKHI